jgi:hypothetical protein
LASPDADVSPRFAAPFLMLSTARCRVTSRSAAQPAGNPGGYAAAASPSNDDFSLRHGACPGESARGNTRFQGRSRRISRRFGIRAFRRTKGSPQERSSSSATGAAPRASGAVHRRPVTCRWPPAPGAATMRTIPTEDPPRRNPT